MVAKAEAVEFDVVGLDHRLSGYEIMTLAELAEKKPLVCELERDPKNAHDSNAVRVYVNDRRLKGVERMHIGYLRRGVAAVFAPGMDRGTLRAKSVRLHMVNTDHGWGRLQIKFLKTGSTKRKISP